MSASRSTRARVAVVALAVLCLGGGWLLGRGMAPSTGRGPSYLQQLTDTLGLRADQVAALEAVLGEEDREIDALLSRGLDGIRAEVAARRARTEQQVLAVLDDAQRRRYDELAAAGAR